MRLSNRSKASYFSFLATFFLVAFLFGIVLFLLEHYVYHYIGWISILFVIVPGIFLVYFYFRGRQIFEYDSDGEALNFKNRNVFAILNKPLNDEFPKYKLVKYEILDLLFIRKLYIILSSKKAKEVMLRYDISYLTKKELNDLKFSLSKVSKENRDNIERENR